MAIVVADLVAKIRADTSGVAQGAQAARQELQGVQQSAEQTSRALEIMAGQFAKLHGGTQADALAMFQRTGVQPNAAAMAAAAAAAEKTAAAASAAVAPTQAVARATEDVTKGWTASESSAVRFGAGLLGIGLGFSLVAGAAKLAHDAIAGVLGAQIEWEQSLVRSRAVLGSLAPAVVAMSQAQSQAPGLLGSQTEFLTANLNAAYLSTRFAVPQSDVFGLTSGAGRVSNVFGYNEQQRADLQARALGFAESGGSGLRSVTGTEGDPLTIARRLGGVSPGQLQALTPQQLRQAQTSIADVDLNQAALRGGEGREGLLTARTNAEQALLQAQGRLQTALEGGAGSLPGSHGVAGQSPLALQTNFPLLGGAGELQQRGDLGLGPGTGNPEQPRADIALTKAVQEAQAAFDEATKTVGDATKAEADATAALAKLGVEAGTAAFRLLGFTGSLEDPRSIARLDVSAQAQAAVASRAVGPNPIQYQSPADIAAQAMERASQDALKAFIAPTAQASQQQNQAIRQRFEQQANEQGPGLEDSRAAGQAAVADLNRRQAAETARLQAQQAGALAQRAQTEAQSQLSTISIQQDERRLSVAQELAGYRTQSLQLEGQLAPIMLQQANLQDRIVVASRDNLASRRELIAAQQQQLGTSQVSSTYDYQQQRAIAVAQQRQARQMLGQDTSDLPSYDQLIEQNLSAQVNRRASGADVAALDANRRVQVVGQQRTGEQLGRDVTLTGLEGQGRALQDQQIPLDQRLRAIQQETNSIQRGLELRNLEDTQAITAAQRQQLEADSLLLTAEATARQAGDLAANLDLGATAAERSQAALSLGYAALNDSAVVVASIRDIMTAMPPLPAPISAAASANGGARVPTPYDPTRVIDTLPGAPMPPLLSRSAGNPTPDRQPTVNAPFVINMLDPEAIVKAATAEFERLLRDGLRQSGSSGIPASPQLAGARHQ